MSFFLKRKCGTYELVNASRTSERIVSRFKCYVDEVSKNHVDVFEPQTGVVIYSGSKDGMKDGVREAIGQFGEFMESKHFAEYKEQLDDYLFGHYEEIYQKLYGKKRSKK